MRITKPLTKRTMFVFKKIKHDGLKMPTVPVKTITVITIRPTTL
ncbi:hypothetical protein [Pedobacter nototheniae]|nr:MULTISPECIES: hypothetical protein [Pedobacter]